MIFPNLSTIQAIATSEHISYVAIFLAIVFSGHIVPLPEDAVIFFAGYIAALHHTHFSFSLLLAISVAGPFCADSLLYYIARAHGKYTTWFLPHIKSTVFDRISHELHENTARTVITARFIPGVRLASPLVAGTIKVRPRSFLFSSLAGSISYGAPVFLLGYFFHSYLPQIFHVAHTARHVLFFVALAIILVVAFYFYQRVNEKK